MAIVFEEVSADIAPPPPGDGGNSTGGPAQTPPDALLAQLQDRLAVQRERSARLHAD
ncbi:MAG: hypothetical protein NVS9B10_15560 [Nevskia sp.]